MAELLHFNDFAYVARCPHHSYLTVCFGTLAVALTPAAFGQRIKQLEEQLGTSLFHRTTRSVRLTESGLALLPAA